jgi:hypothetical protein
VGRRYDNSMTMSWVPHLRRCRTRLIRGGTASGAALGVPAVRQNHNTQCCQ